MVFTELQSGCKIAWSTLSKLTLRNACKHYVRKHYVQVPPRINYHEPITLQLAANYGTFVIFTPNFRLPQLAAWCGLHDMKVPSRLSEWPGVPQKPTQSLHYAIGGVTRWPARRRWASRAPSKPWTRRCKGLSHLFVRVSLGLAARVATL